MRKPLVADVKRNSLDDGPGIRSVVFFKGCPLRCQWCQNPETLSLRAEVQRDPSRCMGCGACQVACPQDVARPGSDPEHGARCRRCGACVDACQSTARRLVGEPVEVDALVRRLRRDAPFYKRSGGGVTLSGGEPTLHARHVGQIAAALHAAGIGVLLETCGLFGWTVVEQALLPYVTTVYFDMKLADDERHRRATGHSNRRILANLERLVKRGTDVLVRVPLVPGLTDDEANLAAITAHVKGLGLTRLALLPYNPLWLNKRRGLAAGERGLDYAHDRWMSAEDVSRCEALVEQAGLEIHR